MGKIKAVIFDLDGTLIDTIPLHEKSFIRLFELFGLRLGKKMIKKYMRLNTEEIYKKLNAKKTLKIEMEEFLELRRRIYYSLIRGRKTVFRDVFPCLKRLKGYRLGIATNSSRRTLKQSAPRELLEKFGKTISFSDVQKAKPDPEMLLKLAKKLGTKPENCAVAGDSVMDVRAAKKAGMKAISIYRKTGASGRKELEKEKPLFIAESLCELPKIIGKIEKQN
ncbi:MAG: HAD family hydrolase [Candidatus ainarchaeum sp.]|nr:HAD family hydrolase [Candidatus ainarchaeum sp.]